MGSSFSVYNDTNHTVWIQQGPNWDAVIGAVTALGIVATAGIATAGAIAGGAIAVGTTAAVGAG